MKTTTGSVKLTQKQREMIEQHGVYMERLGVPPAASRIMGLLLISDEVELTFEAIHTLLKLSKSAASNGINFLLATRRIEYITRPGDRKRYFRTRISSWDEDMASRFEQMLMVRTHLKEISDQRTKSTPAFNAKLKQLIQFMEFMHKQVPILFEKWKEQQK
ncbi:MAG TPA: MarR family transcriptional regulator [Bacteroidia bacterium]|nr:MarR family transcriptional regulator [Bacteroidia bacterium]